jgi:hypothetical protein
MRVAGTCRQPPELIWAWTSKPAYWPGLEGPPGPARPPCARAGLKRKRLRTARHSTGRSFSFRPRTRSVANAPSPGVFSAGKLSPASAGLSCSRFVTVDAAVEVPRRRRRGASSFAVIHSKSNNATQAGPTAAMATVITVVAAFSASRRIVFLEFEQARSPRQRPPVRANAQPA